MAKLTRANVVSRGYNKLPRYGYFWGGAGEIGTTYIQPGKHANGLYYV